MAARRLTIAQKIAINRKENEKLKKKIIKDGTRLFHQAVKELFKKYDDLESFDWDQYTPNWNDGQPCVFSCYFDSISINGERSEDKNEPLWKLEQICDLLNNKTTEEARIVMELTNKKDKKDWQVENLKNDLEILRTRNLEDVVRKLEIKREITELLSGIEEEVYEEMFGEGNIVVSRQGINVEDCSHD